MNSNIHGIILFLIALVEFIFAFYLIFRKTRNEISLSFGLFILCVGLWALGIALFRGASSESVAFFGSRSTYVSAAFIATTFVYFSLVYPFKTRKINFWDKIAIIAPGLIVLYLIFFSDSLIKEFPVRDWGRDAIIGPAYHYFGAFFLLYWVWGFKNLLKKYWLTDGIHQQQMRLALTGITISFITGSFFCLFQPWFNNYRYTHFGPESSVIFLAFTAYIIWKK